jgi:hypothetical protein
MGDNYWYRATRTDLVSTKSFQSIAVCAIISAFSLILAPPASPIAVFPFFAVFQSEGNWRFPDHGLKRSSTKSSLLAVQSKSCQKQSENKTTARDSTGLCSVHNCRLTPKPKGNDHVRSVNHRYFEGGKWTELFWCGAEGELQVGWESECRLWLWKLISQSDQRDMIHHSQLNRRFLILLSSRRFETWAGWLSGLYPQSRFNSDP